MYFFGKKLESTFLIKLRYIGKKMNIIKKVNNYNEDVEVLRSYSEEEGDFYNISNKEIGKVFSL